jgi:nitroreductase
VEQRIDRETPCLIETMLGAAVQAPSGDNTQPWRFVLDREQEQITFYLDETRDPSPMNAGQRMARIALGAAIENVLRTAKKNSRDAELELRTPPALAIIRLQSAMERTCAAEETIGSRVTNRRLYDGRPLASEIQERLRHDTPVLEGVRTHWITPRERIHELAHLIGRADALMLGDLSIRRAFLNNIRFDLPAAAAVPEGLSLASLELSAADRLALRMMPRVPDWLLKCCGVKQVFAGKACKLVESASGLCLIVAPDAAESTDLLVGRAMQRAWLALTAEGLAAQPMMSLLVLENLCDNGSSSQIAAIGQDTLHRLREDLRTSVPEIGDGRPAFLLRFGFASLPSGRTGRLSVSVVTTERSPSCNAKIKNS